MKAIIVTILVIFGVAVRGQDPHFLGYTDEAGLPSNEVYSVLEDAKGMIWVGCDAGLFKFDGLRYVAYKTGAQLSKSMTGLTLGASGRLFCYNFKGQVFVVERDSIREIGRDFPKITGLSAAGDGYLYVSHISGMSEYDGVSWRQIFECPMDVGIYTHYWTTLGVKGYSEAGVWFISGQGLGRVYGGSIDFDAMNIWSEWSVGLFEILHYEGELWIFLKAGGAIYRYSGGRLLEHKDEKLAAILRDRKVTALRDVGDGYMWICTFEGVVRYRPSSGELGVFYTEIAFSDCIRDRTGDYWFSTLQSGLMRVRDFEHKLWQNFENNRLMQSATDGQNIYVASVNGHLYSVGIETEELSQIETCCKSDILSLEYEGGVLRFSQNNRFFERKGDTMREVPMREAGIKSTLRLRGMNFVATSHGLYIDGIKQDAYWGRELKSNKDSNLVWMATNQGLARYAYKDSLWQAMPMLLGGDQILSIDYAAETDELYAVAFDGSIYKLANNGASSRITQLPPDAQAYKIRHNAQDIYTATNKGLWIWQDSSLKNINTLEGLASDNVQDIEFSPDAVWLSTGKGLQKLPLKFEPNSALAKVYVHKIQIGDSTTTNSPLLLRHNQSLKIYVEASAYHSKGQFQYAYKLNDNDWARLPSNISYIEIANPPIGPLQIQIKTTDHQNHDSANTVVLLGRVTPPFWGTWWFLLLAIAASGLILFWLVKRIIANIRLREQEKTELVNSKLTALKAQMNPHFIYNTLNSIQALIIQQDLKNTNLYLSQFSHLMRKVLDVSGQEEISLDEEVDILQLYLSLEKLRFGPDFSYHIHQDPNLDHASLPPLLLQPFVENALKHGLLHLKGKKQLSISLLKSPQGLTCLIQDNGVGRRRSQEIKQRQYQQYQSFSTQATARRIELLNHTGQQKISLSISDLEDQGTATGTLVTITITPCSTP